MLPHLIYLILRSTSSAVGDSPQAFPMALFHAARSCPSPENVGSILERLFALTQSTYTPSPNTSFPRWKAEQSAAQMRRADGVGVGVHSKLMTDKAFCIIFNFIFTMRSTLTSRTPIPLSLCGPSKPPSPLGGTPFGAASVCACHALNIIKIRRERALINQTSDAPTTTAN